MAKHDLDDILKDLGGVDIPAEVRRLAEEMAGRARQDLAQTRKPEPSMWREHLMKNRIVQVAATVAIFAAIGVVSYHLGVSPDGAGVAWGEVLAQVESVPVITYKMKLTMAYPEGRQWVDESDVYVGQEYGHRIDSYKDGQLYMIKYLVPARRTVYIVHPQLKRYMERILPDEEAAGIAAQQDPRQWLKQILAEGYAPLGRSEIDGVEVEGIEAQRADQEVLRLWVDVKTNWPIRIEVQGQIKNEGQLRPSLIVLDRFQWDAAIDPSLFEPNIPADFTLSGPR